MLHTLRYPLFLLVGLLLVLPQGWCCVVMGDVRAAAAEPVPADCCCCPHPPAEEDEPARSPRLCCCGERDLLAQKGPSLDAADGDSADLLTLPFDAPSAGPTAVNRTQASRPPSRPLHVLQCVWLC